VERNPVRAGLVSSAAKWRWSSLGQRAFAVEGPPLTDGPLPRPAIGLSTWMAPKPRANWRTCASVPRAARRLEVSSGSKERPNAWVSSRAWRTSVGPGKRIPCKPKIKTTPDPWICGFIAEKLFFPKAARSWQPQATTTPRSNCGMPASCCPANERRRAGLRSLDAREQVIGAAGVALHYHASHDKR